MSTETSKPLYRCNSGFVQGAVFADGDRLSVAISKRFKDRESGEFKTSKGSFFVSELPGLMHVASLCLRFCDEYEA